MERVLSLLEAIPYLRAYAGQRFVIKAGGGLLARPAALMRDVAALRRLGIGVVLVHGGGPQLDEAARSRGLVSRKVAGRRITGPAELALAAQVWRGELSLSLVSALREAGELAVPRLHRRRVETPWAPRVHAGEGLVVHHPLVLRQGPVREHFVNGAIGRAANPRQQGA